MKKIIRVFPRKTNLTPDDEDVVINMGPSILDYEVDEVHVSVLFKHDVSRGYELAEHWEKVAKVKIGGVGLDQRGEDFVPGFYVKRGAVITSRGCNNRCWFCSVWKRDGRIRELPITEGYNVLDDNLFSCSESHIRNVFEMLEKQKKKGHRIQFTGGIEAGLIADWHIDLLYRLKPKQMFFSYDQECDAEKVANAGEMLKKAGFRRNCMRCYVLIGYYGDTFNDAEHRLKQSMRFGFMPMAMLYMDDSGRRDPEWRKFQRYWSRPAIMAKEFEKVKK